MAWDDVKTPHEKLVYQIELKRDLRLHNGIDYVAWDALRAVVELHQPYWVDSDTYNIEFCKECIVPIPCKTIQAIEKELK